MRQIPTPFPHHQTSILQGNRKRDYPAKVWRVLTRSNKATECSNASQVHSTSHVDQQAELNKCAHPAVRSPLPWADIAHSRASRRRFDALYTSTMLANVRSNGKVSLSHTDIVSFRNRSQSRLTLIHTYCWGFDLRQQ